VTNNFQIPKIIRPNPIDGSKMSVIQSEALAGDAFTSTPQVAKTCRPCLLRSAAYYTIRYDNNQGVRTACTLSCLGKPYNKVSFMLPNSKSTIISVLESFSNTDPSITKEKIDAVVRILDNDASPGNAEDTILTRSETATRFHMSVKAVDYHCRRGDFKRVYIGSSSRARGISRRSVEAALQTH